MPDLPKLAGCSPVTDAEVEALRAKGHVIVRGVFSPDEIAAYRPSLQEYALEMQKVGAEATDYVDTVGTWTLADAPKIVVDFVTAPRLGALAARLLQADVVRILYFQNFFKSGFGPPNPLHQDTIFVPLDTDKALMIWIPLVDVTPEMGGLVFAEGSHTHGGLDPAEAVKNFSFVKNTVLRVGDVSIHDCRTLHGSLKNTSGKERQAMGVCFYADGVRIGTAGRHRFDDVLLKRVFPGLGPGDIARSALTPVVFQRQGAHAHD